jgi:5-aminolevulinate synthase
MAFKRCFFSKPIDYPTVPVGTERLRITPSPLHTPEQTKALVAALASVWDELSLNTVEDWKKEGGRVGVGAPNPVVPENLWTQEQLGLAKEVPRVVVGQENNNVAQQIVA